MVLNKYVNGHGLIAAYFGVDGLTSTDWVSGNNVLQASVASPPTSPVNGSTSTLDVPRCTSLNTMDSEVTDTHKGTENLNDVKRKKKKKMNMNIKVIEGDGDASMGSRKNTHRNFKNVEEERN